MKDPTGFRAARIEAKRLLATERLGTRPGTGPGPLASAFRSLVRGPVKALADGFRRFVGSTTPASVAVVPADASPGSVSENSSPGQVEAAMAELFAWDRVAMGKLDTGARALLAIAKAEKIQNFISQVSLIDPSGRIVEHVETGTPAQQKQASVLLGGILSGISTRAASKSGSLATAHVLKPGLKGLARTLAAFTEESTGRGIRASRPPAAPVRASATPPSKAAAAPATAPELARLDLVEAAFKAESAGTTTAPRRASEPRPLFGIARAEAAFRNSK